MIAIASVNVNTVAFVTYMAKRAVVYFREHSEYGLIVSSIITDVPELNRPEMNPNTHTHKCLCDELKSIHFNENKPNRRNAIDFFVKQNRKCSIEK